MALQKFDQSAYATLMEYLFTFAQRHVVTCETGKFQEFHEFSAQCSGGKEKTEAFVN